MRMNKAIREFMQETLDKKRYAANRPAREAYEADRNACIKELETRLMELAPVFEEVLTKYDMDVNCSRYGKTGPVIKQLCSNIAGNVENHTRIEGLNKAEKHRRDQQTQIMRDIELDMAFGADKEAFLERLNSVEF